jgi:hypothetical protein
MSRVKRGGKRGRERKEREREREREREPNHDFVIIGTTRSARGPNVKRNISHY